MRFSIRDLLLVTLVVALALGWLVDHWRASGKDAEWEKAFQQPLNALRPYIHETLSFETPNGPWRVIPDHEVPVDETAPR
jgi:hypothetical protein